MLLMHEKGACMSQYAKDITSTEGRGKPVLRAWRLRRRQFFESLFNVIVSSNNLHTKCDMASEKMKSAKQMSKLKFRSRSPIRIQKVRRLHSAMQPLRFARRELNPRLRHPASVRRACECSCRAQVAGATSTDAACTTIEPIPGLRYHAFG